MVDLDAERAMAMRWLIRMEEPGWTDRHQHAFDRWLGDSADRRALFWRLEHGWRKADRIIAVDPGPAPRRALWPLRRRVVVGLSATVALAASIAAFVIVDPVGVDSIYPAAPPGNSYRTVANMGRSVETIDGSRIDMAAATRMRTRVMAAQRDVWLDEGEAFFSVRNANNRPFRVHAGRHLITVLGTRFSVRLHDGALKVAVYSGRVRISGREDDQSGEAAVVLTPNKIAMIDAAATVITDMAGTTEKTTGAAGNVLLFSDANLADALGRFPEYRRKHIVFGDAAARDLTITGRFDAGNTDAFRRLLANAYGVSVDRGENGDIVVRTGRR